MLAVVVMCECQRLEEREGIYCSMRSGVQHPTGTVIYHPYEGEAV